ncbi:MAG: glutathione S-transferase family protein [Gammaproteobacteria bacterium]|jgi:glutathione S-transferase
MILFGSSISPFVRKVLMFAAEKGIALESRPVSPHSDDHEFRAASPFGKIPALVDGDYTLADSTAIVSYLEAKYPATPLIPLAPKARGKAIWYEEYADTVMFPVGSAIFVNRVLLPKMRKVPGDFAKAAELEAQQIPLLFSYLESVLPAQGFLVGDSISIGDIAVTCMLINGDHSGIRIDAAKFPKLAAYYTQLSARPSVSGLIAAERKLIGG